MASTILYLNDTHNVPGGGEDQLIWLVQAARKAGLEAIVGCIPGSATNEALISAGIETTPVSRLRTNPIAAVFDVLRICRRRAVKLIHTGSFLSNFVGRLAGRRAGIPVFTSVYCEPDSFLLTRDSFVRRRIFWLRALIERLTALRYTDVFIAVSQAVADKLIAGGIPSEKVHVVPNGVDIVQVRRRAAETPPVSLPPGRWVGSVARLEAVKGIDYLLEAIGLLASEYVDIHLAIIGNGSHEQQLKAEVEAMGISDRVRFLGYLENQLSLMAQFDIYVLPSLSEGLSVTLLEAAALGLPIVATDVGGNSELVKDGLTGLLVPSRDPKALAGAIKRLLDDSGLAADLAKAGAALVAADFAMENTSRRVLDLYQDEVVLSSSQA